MSAGAFKRSFVNPLVRRLNSEKSGKRAEIERQEGQILVYEDIGAFHQIILTTFGIDIPNSKAKLAYEAGRKEALKLHKSYIKSNPRRYRLAKERLPEIRTISHLVFGKDIFLVRKFRGAKGSIDVIKQAIWKSLVDSKAITIEQNDQIKRGNQLHKGHGVTGQAVSQVEAASSVALLLQKADKDLLIRNLDAFFSLAKVSVARKRAVKSVFSKWNQQVTQRGKLRAQYFSIVTFQIGADNLYDQGLEKGVKHVIRKFVQVMSPQLLGMSTSSTLKDKIEASIVESATPKLGNVTVTPKRNVKRSTKGNAKVTYPKNKITARITKAGVAVPGARRRAKPNEANLVTLMAEINAKLHKVLQGNMVEPALVYRTGEFAKSVEVGTPTKTPGGYARIPYRYQFSPYSVFDFAAGTEPWKTPERDPDILIDKSIREIVAGRLGMRFFTKKTFMGMD